MIAVNNVLFFLIPQGHLREDCLYVQPVKAAKLHLFSQVFENYAIRAVSLALITIYTLSGHLLSDNYDQV
jgi:hypothetical protein